MLLIKIEKHFVYIFWIKSIYFAKYPPPPPPLSFVPVLNISLKRLKRRDITHVSCLQLTRRSTQMAQVVGSSIHFSDIHPSSLSSLYPFVIPFVHPFILNFRHPSILKALFTKTRNFFGLTSANYFITHQALQTFSLRHAEHKKIQNYLPAISSPSELYSRLNVSLGELSLEYQNNNKDCKQRPKQNFPSQKFWVKLPLTFSLRSLLPALNSSIHSILTINPSIPVFICYPWYIYVVYITVY